MGLTRRRRSGEETRRYVRGEITEDEFQAIKETIG